MGFWGGDGLKIIDEQCKTTLCFNCLGERTLFPCSTAPAIFAAQCDVGQQNVDGGGFQIVKSGPDGYCYAQFESLKNLGLTNATQVRDY